MFGYVIPNQAALDAGGARPATAPPTAGSAAASARSTACAGGLTLSYDLTFLNLLLSSLYEGETRVRAAAAGTAPSTPSGRSTGVHSGPTDYCADLSVALHYYNAAG